MSEVLEIRLDRVRPSDEFVEKFLRFLQTFRDVKGRYKYIDQAMEMIYERRKSLIIDFTDLISFDQELALRLVSSPVQAIKEASEAVRRLVELYNVDYAKEVGEFHARFRKLPRVLSIRELRSTYLNKFIAIEGIVTRVTPVRSMFKKVTVQCVDETGEPVYKYTIYVGDNVLKFKPPKKCPKEFVEGEEKKKLTPEIVEEECEYVDFQKIMIQEKPEELPPGQMPRSVEAILLDDLVDTVKPGDRVVVTGILKPMIEAVSSRAKIVTMENYLEVNYIEAQTKEFEDIEITPEDEQKIRKLAKDPNIRERIINSIAPSIYGYEKIKEAIACALFGGVPKVFEDGTRVRGDIHILIVGDPGVAKSQLLKYVARIAPRGIYTSGKGSSAAGLTATVVRDKLTGEYYLEAGALVLADGGVACIDEFDKMDPKDRAVLHEAMEQQTISIAKAGIVATLNARTAIIAAANPVYGRYIKSKSLAENIDLPPTILSRFDLIFIIVDEPDVKRDSELAEHVLTQHAGLRPETYMNILPEDLLKKYIAYARKHVKPRLSKEAAERLKEFYTKMRMASLENRAITITPRQLEALIRLAEAEARMVLRDIVTVEDAERAIELMKHFLHQAGIDPETQKIDIGVVMTGITQSKRQRIEIVKDIIKRLSEEAEARGEPGVPKAKVVEEAVKMGISEDEAWSIINMLISSGEVIQPREGIIKWIKL